MYYVTINKQIIAQNVKNGTEFPPVRVTKGKAGKGTYCQEVDLPVGSKLVYSPHKPILKCGARLVIECPTEPTVVRM